MSRLLQGLTASSQAASDPDTWLSSKTELAIYFARRGDVDQATAEVKAIRQPPSGVSQADSIAAANLAEGVLAFCNGQHRLAADKLRRAESLALICRRGKLLRSCLAWAAHLELNRGNLPAVATLAARVLNDAEDSEHLTVARLASTLAVSLHHADRYDLARPWYERAHRHSTAVGDDQGIDAILHNTVAFRVNNVRITEIDGTIDPAEVKRADQEYRSSKSYVALKAPSSFRWSLPLIEPQLQMLAGETSAARVALVDWLAGYSDDAPQRLRAVAQADLALLLALEGDREGAIGHLSIVDREPVDDQAIDEQALIHFRRHQVQRLLGLDSSALESLASAAKVLEVHRAEQRAAVLALGHLGQVGS